MAFNVFGTPVTNETLKGMVQYHDKTITRKDRASVAFQLKNAEGKDRAAREYVEALKEKYDKSTNGKNTSTRCLIYNATGDTLKFFVITNWTGQLDQSPYPVIIANGQWATFFHVQKSDSESKAAVVYAGKNDKGQECQWLLSWINGYNHSTNQVYTEVREAGQFNPSRTDVWKDVVHSLDHSGLVHKEENQKNKLGCASYASISDRVHAICEGIFTLDGAIDA